MEQGFAVIVGAKGMPLPKGGFRYFAVCSDGSAHVIRAKATRRYTHAHQFSGIVATGKTGLAAHFAFSGGSAPRARDSYGDTAVRSFVVQWE